MERPTKPGFYWVRFFEVDYPSVIEIYGSEIWGCGNEEPVELSAIQEWIAECVPPKNEQSE